MLFCSKVVSNVAFCFLFICLVGLSSSAAICEEKAGKEGNGNAVIGPDYKIDPDLTDKGNPKGKSFEFSMRLADSKYFSRR